MDPRGNEPELQLLKSALAYVLIPEDPKSTLEELISGADENGQEDGILGIKQREMLFFDEVIRAFIVLGMPPCPEEALTSYVSRLEINYQVWAIDNAAAEGPDKSPAPAARDLINFGTIANLTDPIVLVSQIEDDGGSQVFVNLAWEVNIKLSRPRIRLGDPVIHIVPLAAIGPKTHGQNDSESIYLEPFQPQDWNVFEPLRGSPGFGQKIPYLPSSRLKGVPTAQQKDEKIRLRNGPSRHFKVVPAVIARLKFTRLNVYEAVQTTISSLDIEVVPFVEIGAEILKVDLTLAKGVVESYMPGFLPMPCRSRDCLTFLSKLSPAAPTGMTPRSSGTTTPTSNLNVDTLSVSVEIQIRISETCLPKVCMDWNTNVDFSQALNPSFGPPSQTIQRANRPPTLLSLYQPGSRNQSLSTTFQSSLAQPTMNGITISFTAPPDPVQLSEPFTWQVLIVNRSNSPIKLSILPIPRISRSTSSTSSAIASHARRHAPKTSTASFHPSEARHTRPDNEEVDVAQAVLDENVLYAMQHSSSATVAPETELVAMTAELRIGPLGVGQCHEGRIEFVAYKRGVLKADAIRVVDLVKEQNEGVNAPGVICDVRNLPDIVVV